MISVEQVREGRVAMEAEVSYSSERLGHLRIVAGVCGR